MKRIGILTAGGDCPGLNAAIRGVAKAAKEIFQISSIGFLDGFEGLINNNYIDLDDTSGLLDRGGTILRTSREKPFRGPDSTEKLRKIKDNYDKLGLECLVIIGGNGTQKTAYRLKSDLGLNILTLPKTIDNDIYGTDTCFGFASAYQIASEAIDRIHTTAVSHNRVMVVEVMGHKVGWLSLYAGVSSGCDIILIPEIPFSFDKIAKTVEMRIKIKKKSTIIAVAEGAKSLDEIDLTKEELEEKRGERSVGQRVASKLKERGFDTRLTVLGHIQRGGSPIAFDRILATNLGTYVAQLINKGKYGYMVALRNNAAVAVPLKEVAGKLRVVGKDEAIIHTARSIGICLGEED